MWEYTDKVREHFLNPKNVGEIEHPDGVGDVGSIACGDALHLTFKLDDQGRIADAKFKTFGCASAIASASALTELIKGKTLEEAEKITNQEIANYLGGLPKEKMHCSVMGQEALEQAIASYRGTPTKEVEGTVVCECFGVTDLEIERAVRENSLKSVEDVTNYTKAGGGCERCHGAILELIAKIQGETVPEAPKPLTNIQKIKLIEETIEREIRPSLRQDGGNIELVDVIGNRVQVATRGACASCPSAPITMKNLVEAKLREFVSPDLVVEEVSS
ncbi:MAG: Fe-S cluster assembly protein NifU [Deltaproteobacteria bacterium]|nr:Fe-S cluster assembly protein NifU [Candidatus Anaeroferrophillus wilburensis]MBN2887876.1 Fe-S cluster assembly protein NifU [Deltaproteobacteria bacterium]